MCTKTHTQNFNESFIRFYENNNSRRLNPQRLPKHRVGRVKQTPRYHVKGVARRVCQGVTWRVHCGSLLNLCGFRFSFCLFHKLCVFFFFFVGVYFLLFNLNYVFLCFSFISLKLLYSREWINELPILMANLVFTYLVSILAVILYLCI